MAAEARVTGHFGEFLQGRIGPKGPVALVTLPCVTAQVKARRILDTGFATNAPLPRAALTRFASALGTPLVGQIEICAQFPAGAGCGVSTAALIALARLAGQNSQARVIRACLAAEGASDPLMFSAPARRLWASRRGRAVRALPAPPAFSVLGGLWGPPVRTRATDSAFADIADLFAPWTEACAARDAPRAAALARESAQRNASLRGPADDPTDGLCTTLGALGYASAHTGSARAFLFRPRAIPRHAAHALAEAGYTHLTRFEVRP